MLKEKYSQHVKQTAINVVQTKIESIRRKDITKTGIRVYDNESIGIAGAIGKYDEEELTAKAKKGLELKLEYPYEPSKDKKAKIELEAELSDGEEFIKENEELLAEITKAQPEFNFSNKIRRTEVEVTLKNDANLDLAYNSSYLEYSLIFKHKDSANLFDGGVGYNGWKYNRKDFLKMTNEICGAFKNEITDFEEGKYPVVFDAGDPTYLNKFYEALHGLMFGTGSSLFTGKIGQKLFNENFTLYTSKNPEDGVMGPFFDVEGIINKDYRYPLIEKGTLVSPYTNKKAAKLFDLPLTGCAGGEYDSVPDLGFPSFRLEESEKTMKEILGGKKGILVIIAAGGDFTPDGSFASPVQLSFLFDGENFIGRLPQLNISSHLYEMFGDSFMGVSKDSLTPLSKMNTAAMEMKVTKI